MLFDFGMLKNVRWIGDGGENVKLYFVNNHGYFC